MLCPIQYLKCYFRNYAHFRACEENFYYLSQDIYFKKGSWNILQASFQVLYAFGMLKYLLKCSENYLS